MRIWVTLYALTKGIQEMEAEVSASDPGTAMVRADRSEGWVADQVFLHPDWHDNRKAAVLRAELMRRGKLASVERQKAKLERMRFD